jgi:hypothetical protein
VVDLSLGEEDAFPNTLWDEKIARKLFGDLNRGLLGPLGDGNMIILSDSDEEEEEVHEDYHTILCGRLTAHTASVAADDDAPDGCKMIVVAVAPLIWCEMIIGWWRRGRFTLGCRTKRSACMKRELKNLRIMMILQCHPINSFAKENGDGNVESLLS